MPSLAASPVKADTTAAVMDKLLLKYLQTRGYYVYKGEDGRPPFAAEPATPTDDVSLDKYARQLGLTTEACAANHLVR